MVLRFIIIFCFFTAYLPARNYDLQNFSENDKIAQAFTYSIIQDNNGYLWVGTSNGLFKYDGFSFEYFTKQDSLANNFITSSINYEGCLWFGHRSGQLSYYKNKEFVGLIPQFDELSSITDFNIGLDKSLWASTYSSGLIKIEADKLKQLTFKGEPFTIQSFKFVTENTLLIGSDDGVRYCKIMPSGKISILQYFVEIPKTKISSIIKAKENNEFYISTGEGQGIYKLKILDKYISCTTILSAEQNKGIPITELLIDKQNNLWFSSFGNGAYQLSVNTDQQNELPNRLTQPVKTANNIKCLFQDRDENIWLGNYGSGISKLSKNPFVKEKFSDVLLGMSTLSIAIDSNYKWIGTEKALLCYNSSDELINVYTSADGLPKDRIRALYSQNNNELWIGTVGNGLYKLDIHTGNFSSYFLATGFLENSITSLAGFGNQLWVGTKKGACLINLKNNQTKWFNLRDGGLPHNVINAIYTDKNNQVWIVTQSNVLSCYKDGGFEKISVESNNGVITLNSITQDNNGNLWVGSDGKGVYKIANDSILNLGTEEGLFSDYCYSMVADRRGFVWVGHKGGITRININNLSTRSIQSYAKLHDNDFFSYNATAMDAEGKLWMGLNTGVLCYNPQQENKEFLPPILNLIDVKVNDKSVPKSTLTSLKPGNYKIEFKFIGVSLKNPEAVKYQYRLLGFDPEWSKISKKTSVSYPRLNYGKYSFELNAESGDGVSAQNLLKIEVLIRKPIWNQWWFYILVLLFFVLLIYLYIRRREFKLLQQNIHLERTVKERTKELQIQRDLIQKKNTDITDSMRYAREIQAAIIPSEETLREALPQHFLINMPKDIVSGDFCWYAKNECKDVIAITDCTGHGIPGAIMSMLSITLFNEVVSAARNINSAKVLEVLRKKVISALSQQHKEHPSYDGMNVALCIIDKQNKHLQYSGAFHNLLHYTNGELRVIKADRTPIGHTLLGLPKFTAYDIYYKTGDVFYMYTDGFPDQFGGPNDKKFNSKRIIKLLNEIAEDSMEDQKKRVLQELNDWMNGTEQTDDIAILGFRF